MQKNACAKIVTRTTKDLQLQTDHDSDIEAFDSPHGAQYPREKDKSFWHEETLFLQSFLLSQEEYFYSL